MINNKLRIGNFTSSEIVALTTMNAKKDGFGKPAFTYIEETNMERKLGRSITDESNARPLTWGKLIEVRPFEQLGLEYILTSDQTKQHPTIPYWAGSKDGLKVVKNKKAVIDIKCPITLKSFCQLVDALYKGLSGINAMDYIRDNHKDGDKYYWQLVSNAIIEETNLAELIVYMPYYSELDEIKLMAQNVPTDQLSKHYWIAMACDDELPYLVDGGYYKNVNVISFEIPQSDIDFLTERVKMAGNLLVDPHPIVLANMDESVNATIIQ